MPIAPVADRRRARARHLDLRHVAQIGQRWCWAACVKMVLDWYGEPHRQSAIVERELGHDGCCDLDPPRPRCDHALDLDRVAAVWHAYGFSGVRRCGPLRFAELVEELDRGAPVQVGLGHGATHTALLVGCSESRNGRLLVSGLDPYRISCGRFRVPYPTLREQGVNGHGPWQLSWVGIARRPLALHSH